MGRVMPEDILVDECDRELLQAHTWYVHTGPHPSSKPYIRCNINRKTVALHRLLMQPPPGMEVDHINGDTLDNRRCNLRNVSKAVNQRNRRLLCVTNKSGHRGVCWYAETRKWKAYVYVLGKYIHLGYFDTQEEAALAAAAGRAAHYGEEQ